MQQQARPDKVRERAAGEQARNSRQPHQLHSHVRTGESEDIPFRGYAPEHALVVRVDLRAQAGGQDELPDGGGEAAWREARQGRGRDRVSTEQGSRDKTNGWLTLRGKR